MIGGIITVVVLYGIMLGIWNMSLWSLWLFRIEEYDFMLVFNIGIVGEILLNCVGSVILFYSFWYIWNDVSFNRFIGIFSLFIAGMSIIIVSGDILSVWIGWEGIAITSYGLISFEKNIDGIKSGLKGLMFNRIGDIGLMMSMILGLSIFGDIYNIVWLDELYYMDSYLVIGMGLILGCWTKSAQFGFNG